MSWTFLRRAVPLCVLALLALAGSAAAAPITYQVTVNTSSFNGIAGALDLQFNPSDPAAQAATATISDWASDGTLGAVLVSTGGASGSLPSTLSIDNSSVIPANEHQQAFTYGDTITFKVTFSGPALDMPNNNGFGSRFSLFLLDDMGNPVGTEPGSNVLGEVLDIDINSDGTTTPTTYPSEGGGPPLVTVEQVPTPPSAEIPEPSSLVLLGLGGAALWGARRLRRRG